jgi:PAS domain S-box-containing protein
MNIYSILANAACIIYLYLGIYVLRMDTRSSVNRLFFLVCLGMGMWAFAATFAFSASTKEGFLFWFKLGCLPNIPFYPLTLHFCLILTGIVKVRPLLLAIIYGPALPLFYRTATGNILFKDFVKVGNHWEFVPDYESWWLSYNALYYFLCMAAGIVCFAIWSRRADNNKNKKQGKIIAIAMTISVVIVTADEIFLSLLDFYTTRALSPVFFLIWMGGIWYAIAKYRFMSISPAVVSECIVANIEESFILLDDEFRIVRVNKPTEILLNAERRELLNRDFSEIVLEREDIRKQIERMHAGEFESFSGRFHFKISNGGNVLMDSKFKIVRDSYNDTIGVLIIGREVKEMKRFREIFRITRREVEIINCIIQGDSNREIAQQSSITEETVKTHIKNIYNKLGVNNKMQLLHLLKEYELISQQSADKTAVLLK